MGISQGPRRLRARRRDRGGPPPRPEGAGRAGRDRGARDRVRGARGPRRRPRRPACPPRSGSVASTSSTTSPPSTSPRSTPSSTCRPTSPTRPPRELREMAARAFRRSGCEGLARVDFFVLPDGSLVLNEINTMPGFTPTSMYPRMWAATGVDYPALVDRLSSSRCSAAPACAEPQRSAWLSGTGRRVVVPLHHRRRARPSRRRARRAVRRGHGHLEHRAVAGRRTSRRRPTGRRSGSSGTYQPTPSATWQPDVRVELRRVRRPRTCSDDRRVAPGGRRARRPAGSCAASWPATVVGQRVDQRAGTRPGPPRPRRRVGIVTGSLPQRRRTRPDHQERAARAPRAGGPGARAPDGCRPSQMWTTGQVSVRVMPSRFCTLETTSLPSSSTLRASARTITS